MIRRFSLATTILLCSLLGAETEEKATTMRALPPLPDKEGFAGPFAGVSNGALLVAGGANFPGKKPWEGGTKVWYDTVFVLEKPDGKWQVAGKMPRPLGYGVAVTHGNGVVCVGGSDADRFHAAAFRLSWQAGKLVTENLPPLPRPLANSCGALVGDTLYIAGGQDRPDAHTTVKAAWKIDLAAASPKWQEIEPFPGPARMLSIAAGFDGAFWLIGGTDLVPGADGKAVRRYLKDCYRFEAGKGWQRIADFPHPVVAAASPAPVDARGIYVLGGDDGTQVTVGPDAHRGFSKKIFRLDARSGTWQAAGDMPAAPATVPCVLWNKSWVLTSGEIRPGVRSPEVWGFRPSDLGP